jgi:S1-C subfamily serine protease/tetratricopeptide (TPR) repeat protein
MKKLLTTTIFLTTSFLSTNPPARSNPSPPSSRLAQADLSDGILTPQQVRATAKNISVRITANNNGGSGVIIAQKAANYLILTNAHIVRRATKIEIIAPDGQKYTATPIDGGFNAKSDLALLQFTSKTKYTLADLSNIAGSPIEPSRTIYSAGFPFDSKDIRITKGQISQLSDIPFDDGTQIGYVTDKGEKGIRQGMNGGAIFDAQGRFLGINTISVAPILPNYTYNDGSKPSPKLKALYARANWGIPVYNFLTNVKADILYGYENLPKVEHQVTPTGYLAKLNIKARQMTVRIENSGGSGSGVIVGKEGNSYYVLTAKHVIRDENDNTHPKFTDNRIITYDRDTHPTISTVVAEGVDLAIVKFSSSNNYAVAKLGEYSLNDEELAFVGGFPGRDKINSPLWQWQLNPGDIYNQERGKLVTQDRGSFSNGYDLIYTSISYQGMSGGPVFDPNGNVIGIHGRSEAANLNSLGISIQTFIGLAAKLQMPPSLLRIVKNHPDGLNPGERDNVIKAMKNIPQPQAGDDGKRWLDYANQLYRTAQYDKSVVAFDKAIAKNQKLMGNYGKALSLLSIGKYRLAEIAIDLAIAQLKTTDRPNYYYFWKYRSVIIQRLEKYDEALRAIDLAILLHRGSNNGVKSEDLALLNEKALILESRQQYPESIAIYSEIISKQPESYAYNNRGTAKSQLGKKSEAIGDYDRAIALNPKFAQAYYNRGNAKYALGNKPGAIGDYDLAIALNPQDAQAYNNRGIAKLKLGNKQGIADLTSAAELFRQQGQIADYQKVTRFVKEFQ